MHVEEANMGGMGKGKQKETLTTESKSGEPGAVGPVRHTVKSTSYYMEGKPKPRLEGTHPRSLGRTRWTDPGLFYKPPSAC